LFEKSNFYNPPFNKLGVTRAAFPEDVHLGSPEGHQRFFNLNFNSKWGFVCFCRRCSYDGPNYQSSLVKCQKVKVHVNTVGDGDEEKSRCEIAGESEIELRERFIPGLCWDA